MWDHGRALTALATWLRLEPSGEIAGIARGMIAGLASIALHEADYWYFPAENWTGAGWGNTVLAHPPTGLAIDGLVDLAQLMADEQLLEVAGRFVRAVLGRKPALFAEDGTMVPKGGGPYDFCFTHVHSRLVILLGLIKYAWATRDRDLLDWCTRAYLFVKEKMSSPFGWVPESLDKGTDPGVSNLVYPLRDETCGISDMMQIAAFLADHGRPEERFTVGRYGANQLFAHQLIDFTPFARLIGDNTGRVDTPQTSYRNMPERCLGAFTAGTYPNELTVDLRSFGGPEHHIDAAGCCGPAGIKALCVLWREAVQRKQDSLHINLWVSLENDDVSVRCEEPVAGQLHVQVKQPCEELVVHVPDYIKDAAELAVDRKYVLKERELHLGRMRGGENVTVTYPLVERTNVEWIAGEEFQVRWRGGRVVGVWPPAKGCATYWWRQCQPPR